MAMIDCPACGKPISSFAVACPHCGRNPLAVTSKPARAKNPEYIGFTDALPFLSAIFGTCFFFVALFITSSNMTVEVLDIMIYSLLFMTIAVAVSWAEVCANQYVLSAVAGALYLVSAVIAGFYSILIALLAILPIVLCLLDFLYSHLEVRRG